MAAIKTCLLISDDPDDHQILYEATKEVSEQISLMILMDGQHVLQLLSDGKIKPDYIVADLEMEGMGKKFLNQISDHKYLEGIPIIIHTDESLSIDGTISNQHFLSKRLSYSEICAHLREVFR